LLNDPLPSVSAVVNAEVSSYVVGLGGGPCGLSLFKWALEETCKSNKVIAVVKNFI
jgi:hypothetical protein